MLIDKVEAIFVGGSGGNGKSSFRRNEKGPDGGNGGKGGDLYVKAVRDIFLLNQFTEKLVIAAENGKMGSSNNKSGHGGEDLVIDLPIGTSITDKETGNLILELNEDGETKLLCKGGRGGLGNWEFRSSKETTPKHAELGCVGQRVEVVLTLKLIADYGLIGLPNAGKSSLLNELTNANAKIANYAFTTLSPNLGVIKGRVLADIPGLIEGAFEGRGLGISFLKHIEKVETLIHCISCESTDILKDYETIRGEIGKYNPVLLEKREIILLTKTDMLEGVDVERILKTLKGKSKEVLAVSIHDLESIQKIKALIR